MGASRQGGTRTPPIYLDHHSTTPMDRRVFDAMAPYMLEWFGNPSSTDHVYGADASAAVEKARASVARLVGARPDEIVFTSGATESDNLALTGVMSRYSDRGDRLVTTSTEHGAVLDVAAHMDAAGKGVTYLPVTRDGLVDMQAAADAISEETVLVSAMAANNEVGAVTDVAKMAEIAHGKGALFHTDAAQAAGHVPIDVERMGIDLMSFSAHKMYGPKGIGALYVRGGGPVVRLDPMIRGGGHERNRRSGTLNVPGIVGFGRAAEIAMAEMGAEDERLGRLAGRMIGRFRDAGCELNGPEKGRLSRNINMYVPGVESKAIINKVSDRLAISAGSACTTEAVEPSHVLLAMGLGEERAHQSIRIGLGRSNTEAHAEEAVSAILDAAAELRSITG